MLLVMLGLVALVVVVAGLIGAVVLARRQAADELPPESEPSDFVAPVSTGGFRFRGVDETADQFHARINAENAAVSSPAPSSGTQGKKP